ncbi:MAG: tetratricopeptide repeat protein [bacterium]|nr:MAG: tetratricopeptide repeat protein [bacterium]
MNRVASIVVLAVVIAFSYFAFYNHGTVNLTVWQSRNVELPVVGLVLLSMGLGAAIVFTLLAIRGIRRSFDNFQVSIKKKRRAKAEELYNRGVDAHLSGKMRQAVKLLEEAVEKDTEFLLPFFRLGTVYLALGQTQKALELHQKALEAHPGNLRVQLFLVDDYLAVGQLSEAADVLNKIISKDDSNRTALISLRKIQEQQGDWDAAVETQRKLIKAAGKEREHLDHLIGLRYQAATAHLENKDTERAVKTLKDLLKEAPDFVAATVALGDARIGSGKVDDGLRILMEGYDRHQNPVFLQVIEEKLMKKENPRKLIETFRTLLDRSPEDIFLNLFYGKICLRLEMVDEGYMALKKVEASGYDSPFLHALLGEMNARRARYEEAMEEFSRYVELSDGLHPRFICGNCQHTVDTWASRCESCGRWNSFTLPGLTKPSRVPATMPQYESGE